MQYPIILLILLFNYGAYCSNITEENRDNKTFGGVNISGSGNHSMTPIETSKIDWEDLDKRPCPEWYDRAKIGVLIHWGIYSVPSIGSEWFWVNWKNGNNIEILNYMHNNFRKRFTYQDFAPMFTAELFDPSDWLNIFKNAGAKYVILTSKHHDGFALFPSQRSFSWNSLDIGPHKDLVGELCRATQNAGLEFGIYHSLYEWYNPLYLEDKENYFSTNEYVKSKVSSDLMQLVDSYQPSIIWSNGEWENSAEYWNSTTFLRWLYTQSAVKDKVVTNDRWGRGTRLNHGDFYTGWDINTPRATRNHKWEYVISLDKKSYGYRRNMHLGDIMTVDELLYKVVSTVSGGGNALINIGATREGTIPLIFQELLMDLGKFLDMNGEAIYDTSPWLHENDTLNGDVWYTCKIADNENNSNETVTKNVTAIYAIILRWPENSVLELKDILSEVNIKEYHIELLGFSSFAIKWKIQHGKAQIELPEKPSVLLNIAWALKFAKPDTYA